MTNAEPAASVDPDRIEAFIARWSGVTGSEQANSQLFLAELCTALDLPQPEPAGEAAADNAYVFERAIEEVEPDGTIRRRRIDLFRRGAFILESKKVRSSEHTQGYAKTLREAFHQAEGYVRALPASEGRPPFIVVVDVGRTIDLFSEFSRSGGFYQPYPDPRNNRIHLTDLRDPEVQATLRALWNDPDSLDQSRQSAKVTREISVQLAELGKSLEAESHDVERIGLFLMRSLFTMFAEDTNLIPQGQYTALLERLQDRPELFPDSMKSLWDTMNAGGFEGQIMAKLPRFNGGLFRDIDPIPLSSEQIGMLLKAAQKDWTEVEPAIFGTLLERALNPRERHKLGAHYTPRAYVERLVIPTIMEPLREEWTNVRVAALADYEAGREVEARKAVRSFHHRLCETRVLDPACGSGNFLYVAMEHLKRLEGEVLSVLTDMSSGQVGFDTEGLMVDPHGFLGLEINPRAAAITEMVLWIGYLQWHHRLYGRLDNLPEPILRDFHNIENRDALFEYDAAEIDADGNGAPRTVWDGTTKPHPVTGEPVPDETCREPVYRYTNPRRASWPDADFVIGNPPFIGNKRMRKALGDGYVEALREVYRDAVPESADFVMYWWAIAAEKARRGDIRRFGLITTNSLRQSFNRRVIEQHMAQKTPVSLRFAIPDHPWVDSADGAAVRIAMTVGEGGTHEGVLLRSTEETAGDSEGCEITFKRRMGILHQNLSAGANVAGAKALQANEEFVFQGVKLVGNGFLVTPQQRNRWVSQNPNWSKYLPQLVAGADLTKRPELRYCIDFFGLDEHTAREACPPAFQKVLDEVKPHRDQVKRKAHRERYWIYGEARPGMRDAVEGISRYIVTSEVSKHRCFVFLDSADVLADGSLAVVALEGAFHLGVLSSRVHVRWALAQGGTLEDRPRWQNGSCFLKFPFPQLDGNTAARIGELAEKIDAHRKRVQESHTLLTLSRLYTVIEKERSGYVLTIKERTIHDQGVVAVLANLHDELDRAVLEAYGWDDLADALVGRPGGTTPAADKPTEQEQAEEELLERLVRLNAQRVAEEAQGHVRWLRPEFQAPEAEQEEIEAGEVAAVAGGPAAAGGGKHRFPQSMVERVEAIRRDLAQGPRTLDDLAAQYVRKPRKGIEETLQAVAVAGMAYEEGGVWRLR